MKKPMLFLAALLLAALSSFAAAPKVIPIVLDTDIGGDIDDAFALALVLASPELDLRAVTTVSGDTHLRARIAAKMLQAAGRLDGRSGGICDRFSLTLAARSMFGCAPPASPAIRAHAL